MKNHCQGQDNSSESPTVRAWTGKTLARLLTWYTLHLWGRLCGKSAAE